jgi:predicted HNH restriction endonuclease
MQRLAAKRCEVCETMEGTFEVHHIRKLANLKGKQKWEKRMIAMKRKTLILCRNCHKAIHGKKNTGAQVYEIRL